MARTRKQGGSVRRLRSGRWQAMVDNDGRRVSIGGTFDTEQDAHDALRKAVVAADRGTFKPTRSAPGFEPFARREVRLRDIRPRTRAGYESLLSTTLLPFFGARRLDQITIGDVKVWWSIEGRRPVRRRNAYFLLRSVMGSAVDEGLIESSPCRVKDAGKDVAAKRPTFTVADFDAALSHVPAPYHPALEMLFSAHVRLGELIGLNAADYDATSGIVHVTKSDTGPTKTGQEKHVRLLQRGVDAMTDYLSEQPRIGNAPLFSGPKGGRLPRATLRSAWIAACDAAGLEDFHLHDLRHTGLTAVAQAGASLKDIQARGGHASVQAAMRYQHSSAERDAEVAAMVDRRLAGR
jgi:integrase